MKNFVEDIKDFHRKFGLEYTGKPRPLEPDLHNFRTNFMAEEIAEYNTDYHKGDLAGQLDALVDLLYVAFGTAHMHGFDIEKAWVRVHEANMKKTRTKNEAESKRGNIKYDVVKPPGWKPPNLEDLV